MLSKTTFPPPAFKVTDVLVPFAVPLISGAMSIFPPLVLIVRSAASERVISAVPPSTKEMFALEAVKLGAVPVIKMVSPV